MSSRIRELKDAYLRNFFVEIKCTECNQWEEVPSNHLPVFTDGKKTALVCPNCR